MPDQPKSDDGTAPELPTDPSATRPLAATTNSWYQPNASTCRTGMYWESRYRPGEASFDLKRLKEWERTLTRRSVRFPSTGRSCSRRCVTGCSGWRTPLRFRWPFHDREGSYPRIGYKILRDHEIPGPALGPEVTSASAGSLFPHSRRLHGRSHHRVDSPSILQRVESTR